MPARLQDRLALAEWALRHFGVESIDALGAALRDQREDWGTDARTHFFRVLEGLESLVIASDQLAIYDERIQDYAARLNTNRINPVRLKYFQYLGALFAEIFLDRYFGDRSTLLDELNDLVDSHNAGITGVSKKWPSFEETDLRKVAFWMATGSGKTLLLHINLWQFLHYCPPEERPENILLITPHLGLSLQHMRELEGSGIRGRWFGDPAELTLFDDAPVTVIEITKLVETKKGGGLTVEVDAFGNDNLLLVDEAHRGASGDHWRELRRRLGDNGFTFEYSATFGQIVNGAAAASRGALLEEYGKSVLFDYSYSHFYKDGYGKDYQVLNVRGASEEFDKPVVLANALGFLEQRLAYAEEGVRLQPYNIETPLWIFVGHTVTGGSTRSKTDEATLTDVETLLVFFDELVSDAPAAKAAIEALLRGDSGLRDEDGLDLFRHAFPYLRAASLTATQIYDLLLQHVFNASTPARLRGSILQRGDGELALRVGQDAYFGVVNVGDVATLSSLLEGHGIAVESDAITPSLFENINDVESRTNVLVGSRKFMEGWDSFRVSSLGIMNIGRGEGAQIIQLFGRGVRLWGRDYTLKRTQETPTDVSPLALRMVETLGVYGLRADYMQQFRDYLEQEAIPTDFELLTLPTKTTAEDFGDLLVPAFEEDRLFLSDAVVRLRCDEEVAIALDLRPKVDVHTSDDSAAEDLGGRVAGSDRISDLRKVAALFDWKRMVAEFEDFRVSKELWNLTGSSNSLKDVLLNGKIEVLAAGALLPTSPRDFRRLEEIAVSAVRKYAAALYELSRRRWEREQITLVPLTTSHTNIDFGGYALKLDVGQADRFKAISDLVTDGKRIYNEDVVELPSLVWERHLYQPLVIADPTKAILSSMPPELNDGEANFVRDLRTFVEENPERFEDKRLYLLRNLTRGRGVPFFDAVGGSAFYPDFILWLLSGEEQSIGFIDPHGLRHALGGFNDPKITLRLHLKEVEKELAGRGMSNVQLTSVILSTSPHETVRRVFDGASKDDFRGHNILFPEDDGYVESLFDLTSA